MRRAYYMKLFAFRLTQPRKEAYLAHLIEASSSMLLVSLADKIHDARSILWEFAVGREQRVVALYRGRGGSLWYYLTLMQAFQAREQYLDCGGT